MGYFCITSTCAVCRALITYHPHKVPSVRVEGVRQPICRPCVDEINPLRVEHGLPAIPIQDGAYDAADESDL